MLLAATALALPAAMSRTGPWIKADASDPKEMFAQINKAVADMRTMAEAGLNARITTDELNAQLAPVNEVITNLTTSLEAMQKQIEAGSTNGVIGDIPANPEYVGAFKSHMRKGDVSAAMSIGTAADGGYLAPVEWDRSITEEIRQISPIRENAEVISISGQGFSRIFQTGAPGSGWVGEVAARPQTTTPQFVPLTFGSGEIYANPAITQAALDDAAVDLEAWLANQVRDEFARQENVAFLSGNGVNKPTGILTYLTGGSNAALHPLGDIEVTSVGAGLDADDFMKTLYDVRTEALTPNSKWFMNRQTIAAIRTVKDLNGQYIWQPGLSAMQPQNLLGHPIVEVPGMAVPGAAAVVALFGDMRRTYLVIDRIGIRVLRDPYTNKPYVMFYTTKRVGGGVQNPEYMRALKMAVA
jgi:HK97 family phage major capsid protein